MSWEFDSRKDSHSMKLKQRPQIKLSFRGFHGSKLSGLHPFDKMAILLNENLKCRLAVHFCGTK